jgi:hypothetical protein
MVVDKIQWNGCACRRTQRLHTEQISNCYSCKDLLSNRQRWGSSWGGGILEHLDDKLRGRQASLPKVELVCLGQDGESYFIQFEDGTSQWCGNLNSCLQGFFYGSTKITVLALGSDDSFYCRNDGGMTLALNLPKGLDDALTGRKKTRPPVENVNLGPAQEWFVRFSDGSWGCNGCTTLCHGALDDIRGEAGTVHKVSFGHNDSWMVRYDRKFAEADPSYSAFVAISIQDNVSTIRTAAWAQMMHCAT